RRPAARGLGRRARTARHRRQPRHPARTRPRRAARLRRAGRHVLLTRMTGAEGLLCYCRAGFEPKLAAELGEKSAALGHPGYARTERGTGFVVLAGVDGDALSNALPFNDLVFARQKLRLLAELRDLPPGDRITPILHALTALPGARRYGSLLVEHPDSDAGKPLAGLARSFANALRPALRAAGLLPARDGSPGERLHACFTSGSALMLAASTPGD